jgi:DNA-binding MarR family transcriptional regulator
MNDFEANLNSILVDTFNDIIKYEETSLKKFLEAQATITETHMIEAVGKQENEEVTVGKLASLLNISMPTATVAVKKLESKGFIQKRPCEKDGRCIIISLTAMGRKIEKAHRLFHERMVKNISRQFTDTEKEILLRAIKTLSKFFRTKAEAV